MTVTEVPEINFCPEFPQPSAAVVNAFDQSHLREAIVVLDYSVEQLKGIKKYREMVIGLSKIKDKASNYPAVKVNSWLNDLLKLKKNLDDCHRITGQP